MKQHTHWITQGDQSVSAEPDTVIATLLGSCVAVCLWDPVAKAGGMNHMLLARRRAGSVIQDRSGVHAMELLINDLLKIGARRSRLVAKLFGGARMIEGLSDIGEANASFATQFLTRERIVVTGQSLGGTEARQVMFWPATGTVRQRTVRENTQEVLVEAAQPAGNGAELW